MINQTFVKYRWHCSNGHSPYQTIVNYPEYEPPKCLECGSIMSKETNNKKQPKSIGKND